MQRRQAFVGKFATAQPLVETSPASWAETDLKDLFADKEPSFDESKGDKKGPISLGAEVSAQAQERPSLPGSRAIAPIYPSA